MFHIAAMGAMAPLFYMGIRTVIHPLGAFDPESLLDVLEKEPPSHNNPMLGMDNVTLTAHVASASARFDEEHKRRVGYELSLVLQGMWPVSCVNPSVLQNTALRRWQPVSMDRGPNS